MTPVKQTIFNCTEGNCFAACIASILELPLDEVPHCIAADDWWEQYQEWFRERNLALLPLDAAHYTPSGYAILGGLTENDLPHSVVALDGALAWNPLGCGQSLKVGTHWFVFTVLDPTRPAGSTQAR